MAKINKFITEYKEIIKATGVSFDGLKPPKHTIQRFIHLLKEISDERLQNMIEYPLEEIIIITFLAVLANASSWIEISTFGMVKTRWLKKFLKLKNGIPSHDTFNRVFSLINSQELEAATVAFLAENLDKIRIANSTDKNQKRLICIDGKEEKGTGRKYGTKEEVKNLQTLHVYDASYGICLSSEIIDTKTNEIPVAQRILEIMELKNTICTFDALHTQKNTIAIITKQKGDYVGALKGNHPTFESEVANLFAEKYKKKIRENEKNFLETKEKAHNRVEIRRFYLTTNIKWFKDLGDWEKLRSFVCYEKKSVDLVTDKETFETRYYISSLKDVELCADSIRSHWSVENQLHWHLDSNFLQDANSTMNKNAFNNLSIINKMVLSLMKLTQPIINNPSIRSLRKRFAWDLESSLSLTLNSFDNEKLLEIIANANKK